MRRVILFMILIGFWQCQGRKDLTQLPVFGKSGINAVIEIPAGTNRQIEYKPGELQFKIDQVNGQDRFIHFLPYPANYGFIPSTKVDLSDGSDGAPLDILVLCESVPTGTVLETQVIAALLLQEGTKKETKIIAIPSDPKLQVFPIENFKTFLLQQDAAKRIIEDWFLNYKGAHQIQLIRWEDDNYAWKEIEKWKN